MKEFKIEECLINLSKMRKIFHSEADFQFALAWQIKKEYQDDVEINLEMPFRRLNQKTNYIDLIIIHKNIKYPVELKYVTRKFEYDFYKLTNHDAADLRAYDYCKDISRIEEYLLENNDCNKGFCIFLTNNIAYKNSKLNNSGYDDFKIGNDIEKSGILNWGPNISDGTKKGRINSISLKGRYKFIWNDYSCLDNSKYGKFIYNLLEIDRSKIK